MSRKAAANSGKSSVTANLESSAKARNCKGTFCDVLSGSFLVCGDAGSGKTALIRKMDGSYRLSFSTEEDLLPQPSASKTSVVAAATAAAAASPTSTSTSTSAVMSKETVLDDRLAGFTTPSTEQAILHAAYKGGLSYDKMVEETVQRVRLTLREMPPFKTPHAIDELSSALHLSQRKASSADRRRPSYLESFPVTHDLCGTVWVIRGNCLFSDPDKVVRCVYKSLKSRHVPAVAAEERTENEKNVTLEALAECEKRLVDLFKKEMRLRLANTHNEILNVCKLPSFPRIPLVLVLNKPTAEATFSEDVPEPEGRILSKLRSHLKKTNGAAAATADRAIPATTTTTTTTTTMTTTTTTTTTNATIAKSKHGNLRKYPEGLLENVGALVRYGFSLCCDEVGFSNLLSLRELHYKLEMAPQLGIEPTIDFYPNGWSDNLNRMNEGWSWNSKRSFYANPPPRRPTLAVKTVERPRHFGKSGNLLKPTVLNRFDQDSADEAEVWDEYDADDDSNNHARRPYFSLLADKYVEQHGSGGADHCKNPGQAFFPPLISTCCVSLGGKEGKDGDWTALARARADRANYDVQRKKGILAYDPHVGNGDAGGQERTKCDRFEFYLYNWMLDAAIYRFEMTNASKLILVKSSSTTS